MDRPSFQFYPADWRQSANLHRCTWAARGVWIEVMCLLHDQAQYGVVKWPLKDIATTINASPKLLLELVEKGVMKGCDEGVCEPLNYAPRHGGKQGPSIALITAQQGPIWYSSRMVKDEYIRAKKAGNIPDNTLFDPPMGGIGTEPMGGIGGGIGTPLGTDNFSQPSRAGARAAARSSSSSSSSSTSLLGEPSPKPPVQLPLNLDTTEFQKAWADWQDYRRSVKKKLSPLSITQQLRNFEQIGAQRAVAMIRHTIGMGWQGLREPEITHTNGQASSGRRNAVTGEITHDGTRIY